MRLSSSIFTLSNILFFERESLLTLYSIAKLKISDFDLLLQLQIGRQYITENITLINMFNNNECSYLEPIYCICHFINTNRYEYRTKLYASTCLSTYLSFCKYFPWINLSQNSKIYFSIKVLEFCVSTFFFYSMSFPLEI